MIRIIKNGSRGKGRKALLSGKNTKLYRKRWGYYQSINNMPKESWDGLLEILVDLHPRQVFLPDYQRFLPEKLPKRRITFSSKKWKQQYQTFSITYICKQCRFYIHKESFLTMHFGIEWAPLEFQRNLSTLPGHQKLLMYFLAIKIATPARYSYPTWAEFWKWCQKIH